MRSFVVGIIASLVLTLTASTNVAGQASDLTAAVMDAITTARLDTHAREITRYERPSGSLGENVAIDYIAAALAEVGVPVEVHEFMGYTSNPISASVTVPGTDFDPQAITMAISGIQCRARRVCIRQTIRDRVFFFLPRHGFRVRT